jgi:hypothetical protein
VALARLVRRCSHDACFGFFVAIFARVSSWENEQSFLEFRMRSQQLADTMGATLEEQIGFLDPLSSVFATAIL